MILDTFLSMKEISAKEFAANIKRTSAEVSDWRNGKRGIPVIAAVEIEKITNGEVTRQECRPNDWHLIWPELADKEQAHV